MSEKLASLLSAEDKARELVDEATKEARKIRTGIPVEVSDLKKAYSLSLQKKEDSDLVKVQEKLSALQKEQNFLLEKKKSQLSSIADSIEPDAERLMHKAVEGEKG